MLWDDPAPASGHEHKVAPNMFSAAGYTLRKTEVDVLVGTKHLVLGVCLMVRVCCLLHKS